MAVTRDPRDRKSPIRHLDGAEGPAAIVDLPHARIVEANGGGLEALGLSALPPGGLAMDRATPALAMMEQVFSEPRGGARPLDLVFWLGPAPRRVVAMGRSVEGAEKARLVLLRFGEPPRRGREGRSSRPAARADLAPPPSRRVEIRDEPRDDQATLREIARRIRSGRAAEESKGDEGLPQPDEPEPQLRMAPPASEPESGRNERGEAIRSYSEVELAKLAHELRTPLGAIIALAEIMRDERLGAMGNARYRGYAADIHDSALHALNVLSAMLEHADDPVTNRIVETDANAVVASSVSAMRPLADRAGVRLVASLAGRLPHVLADPRALKQILLNLLSNALRHTPHGGEIGVFSAISPDGRVHVEVQDTGSGISAAEIARALAPRPGAAADGKRQTTGFGLPLVRKLAAENDAELTISSEPGAGTRVRLVLRPTGGGAV